MENYICEISSAAEDSVSFGRGVQNFSFSL
jgi:hypothetical protein